MANIDIPTQQRFTQLSTDLSALQREGFLGIGQAAHVDGVSVGVYARGGQVFDRHGVIVDFVVGNQTITDAKTEYYLRDGELTVNADREDTPSVPDLARALGGLTLKRTHARTLRSGGVLEHVTSAEVDFLNRFLRDPMTTGADFQFIGDGSGYATGIEFWRREDIKLPPLEESAPRLLPLQLGLRALGR